MKFKYTQIETPPTGKELLVLSPEGKYYLTSWRDSYHIFTCQNKDESSFDWQWLELPKTR